MQIATREGIPIEIGDAAVAELQAMLHGSLLCPGEAGYDEARVISTGCLTAAWD